MQVFEQMTNIRRQTNLHGGSNMAPRHTTAPDDENRPLTDEELGEELRKWERMMQQGSAPDGAATD